MPFTLAFILDVTEEPACPDVGERDAEDAIHCERLVTILENPAVYIEIEIRTLKYEKGKRVSLETVAWL